MKKLMMLLAFAGFATVASAQDVNYPVKKHQVVTNSFWSNWFVDAGADYIAFYSNQEHALPGTKSPFWPGRRSWGFDLSVGKWANPVFGARIKGAGIWGTQVNYQDYETGANPSFNCWSLSFQPMINLNNLFMGYKPRVWNISAYVGAGFITNTDYVEGPRFTRVNLPDNNNGAMPNQQAETRNDVSFLYTVGLFNTFNVTKRFHINLDIYLNASEGKMDGNRGEYIDYRILKTRDCQFGLSAGVGINLGKVGWDNAPDVDAILAMNQAQVDALNKALAEAEADNDRLKALINNHKCPKPDNKIITEFVCTSASVFFNINETKIASRRDLVNVKELAELAKAQNRKVLVTGYADSKTGRSPWNQTLSEGRAAAVVKELVKMGVNRDNIEVAAKGGVADLDPYPYNRRAVVTLK